MKKLQNIKAVREMLSGTHKTQTKTTVGYSGVKTPVDRKVGDIWTDSNGVTWQQFDGFKSNLTPALDAVREALKSLKLPPTCPKCSKEMKNNQYNKKMWRIHKMCFDCVIEMEHEHLINGTFEEYSKKIMRPNIESWLNDARAEIPALVDIMTKAEYVNSDGTIEKWETPWAGKQDELRKLLEDDFSKLEKQLLEEYNDNNSATD